MGVESEHFEPISTRLRNSRKATAPPTLQPTGNPRDTQGSSTVVQCRAALEAAREAHQTQRKLQFRMHTALQHQERERIKRKRKEKSRRTKRVAE